MTNVQAPRASKADIERLQHTIQQIGLARFLGRINSGVIPSDEGFAAVEVFVRNAETRPFLSRVTATVLGNKEPYDH